MQKADPIAWLLEKDDANPGVRYFALRDLLGLADSDTQLRAAQSAVMKSGPVPIILAAQESSGAWVKSGGGYSPKYRSTVWSLLLLAELGADPNDPRIQKGCRYLLDHSLDIHGAFSANRKPVPSGAVLCLNGNLIFTLSRLGFGDDPRLQKAAAWTARAIVGEQPIQYYASGTAGPNFACGVNLGQPCGWGANKVIRGLLEMPVQARTPLLERALEAGAQFLLSRDPAVADYPYTDKVSSAWFKLGFPLSYWSDVLETCANLVSLGYGNDSRLEGAFEWVLNQQDAHGRWKLKNSLNGKMWVDIEARGKPSKWVTLRVLRVLKGAGRL